ncbi:MAG TPA: hypothetical protein VD962_03530 [Rubricoccaceae bacterium]|nr:hypothetical protein [Rubricoccaceae bacterium]
MPNDPTHIPPGGIPVPEPDPDASTDPDGSRILTGSTGHATGVGGDSTGARQEDGRGDNPLGHGGVPGEDDDRLGA